MNTFHCRNNGTIGNLFHDLLLAVNVMTWSRAKDLSEASCFTRISRILWNYLIERKTWAYGMCDMIRKSSCTLCNPKGHRINSVLGWQGLLDMLWCTDSNMIVTWYRYEEFLIESLYLFVTCFHRTWHLFIHVYSTYFGLLGPFRDSTNDELYKTWIHFSFSHINLAKDGYN